jgi:predicted TIM-barrel fold metal-dependent hydrolase
MREARMTIEKTDAHHHLWRLDSSHYPMLRAPGGERFIGNTGGLKHDFGAAEFLPLARAQNVTRSVYVESHYDPPIAETAHVQAFAEAHGFPHAIVGRVDLASGELGTALDTHMRSPLFRGVRVMVNWDADPMFRAVADPDLLSRPAWRAGYAELGERGLSAEVMAFPAQLAALAGLAADRPGTPLVVGHAGLPLRRTAAEHALWHAGMTALAALPHVVVKLSGLAMVDHHWTVDGIRPIVRELIDLFTPVRAMFASNFPVDGLHKSYDAVWDAFDAITADDPAVDRAALFRDTARRFYRIT